MTGEDRVIAMREAVEAVQREARCGLFVWKPTAGVDGFDGASPDWYVLVVRWPMGAGAYGYDGTATAPKKGFVLHLTRPMAEEFYAMATNISN